LTGYLTIIVSAIITDQEDFQFMAVKKGAKKKAAASSRAGKTARKTAGKRIIKKAVKKTVKRTARAAAQVPAKSPSARVSAAAQKRNELLRRILHKKRNEVVAGLETQMGRKLTRETGQRIDAAMDSADLSSQDMDQGIDYSLLEMRYEQYKDIADAFRKLQNNTFGLCEECGEEIDIKRLQVNPLARYCIACKTKKEEIERIQKEETRFKE
jgi:DnaK suppressor protein